MPRHPPYALKNLNTQNDQNKSQTRTRSHKETASSPEMLASTVQFSKNNRAHQTPPPNQEDGDLVPQSRGTQARACFLRTQQRAHQTTLPNPPFPLPQKNQGRY